MNSAGLVLMILTFIVAESGRNSAMADYRLDMTDIANATLSTQHRPDPPKSEVYNASNAIDGYDETNMSKCLCCTHTHEDDKKPTLKIFLDRPYPIKKMVAYGRTDKLHNPWPRLLNSDVKVYLDNQSVNQSYNNSTKQVTVSLDGAILARNITINRTVPHDKTWFLIVCELVVTVLECEDGQFLLGAECVSCHCTNNYCNSSTGTCPTGGCKDGWIGVSCNQTCRNGKYGKQCMHDCAGHCKDNATCNHTNGICSDGCEAGYEGNTCDTICSSGNYGYGCNNTCGHCKENTACNVVNGNCSTGCVAGYMGDNCKQNCTNNTFGENCVHRCHCEDDRQCHTAKGECPDDQCSIEFGGRNCSIDLNILTNIKDKVITSMSKPYNNWTSDKVIDGIIPTGNETPDTCLCCAATIVNESWWRLNLSMLYPVKAIRFYGRNDEQNHNRFGGFSLYASNSSDMSENPIYTNNMSEPGHVFDIHINDTLLQYINITKKTNLTICEIKVIKGDCPKGTFGDQCSKTCHCADGKACDDFDNGKCETPTCKPGWQGRACDRACTDSFFGVNCLSKCSNCYNTNICNKISGICLGNCSAGYRGRHCNETCTDGFFGVGCLSKCSNCYKDVCNKISGICPGNCSAGYRGRHCNETCTDGFFGVGCLSKCSNCYKDVCNKISGICPGNCSAGYRGRHCNETCTDGFFGVGCLSKCSNCYNTNVCNKISGICLGNCSAGYRGRPCNETCLNGTFGANCSNVCSSCISKVCHPVDGNCSFGELRKRTKEKEEPTTGFIAGMIGAICLCVVLIVVTVCYLRNGFEFASKSKKPKENKPVALNDLTNKTDVPANRVPEENNAADGTVPVEINSVDNTYYSFLPRNEDIKVYQLWDYIQQHMKNGCGPFYSEYKVLERGLKYDHDIALKPENKPKNRYNDMVTYNQSRVKLIPTSSEESDYINASFIDGFEKSAKFIATQGPTTATLADFWRMMWQQKSEKIVMLTRLIEEGKNKCYLYWPEDGKKTFGNITVKALKTDTSTDYVKRHFTMHKGKEAPRSVIQYHFKTWPDKGVPDSAWCLVNFWRVVNQSPSSTDSGPIVVHCSAGIGRTGTYIALDNLYNQAIAEGSIRPIQMVETLRRQRVNMVQTQKQYVYLHEAVAEALLFGTHFVWSSQFKCMYDYMLETEPGSALSRLEVQYNLINASLMDIGTTTEVESEYSNVTTMVSERYSYRPHRTTTNSEYAAELGAMLLSDFPNQDSFLVANSPSEASLHQFWCLVVEQNVKTIISMTSTSAANYKTSFSLGASTCYEDEMFNVTSSEEKSSNFCTERTFSISRKKKTQTGTVSPIKQFHYPLWADDSFVPDNTQSMLNFIEKVNKWRSSTSETGPILIHCGDEDKRSGIVCVLMNEINRLQQDGGRINIIQSMKTMKQRNRDIIPNFEQYKYCHDAVMASIKSCETESKDNNENFDIYQNV